MEAGVLAGFSAADDAGVYRLSADSALVLTVDFFTPIVDDPYDYGRVAAANSLSDVYAMGGRPLAALNVAGFPEGKLPADVLADILRGGQDVAAAAGCAVIGGHTVSDAELKYGMCVAGTIHPDRIVTNGGAHAGDKLVLTKPLGTGLLSTALKKGTLDEAGVRRLVATMTALNDGASTSMLEHGATACTDVTGFGLAGHATELARASGVSVRIDAGSVPVIEGALEAAGAGYLPGGGRTNRAFVEASASIDSGVDDRLLDVVFDPQTSGGLLIAVPPERARDLVVSLGGRSEAAAVVGECLPRGEKLVEIVPG